MTSSEGNSYSKWELILAGQHGGSERDFRVLTLSGMILSQPSPQGLGICEEEGTGRL